MFIKPSELSECENLLDCSTANRGTIIKSKANESFGQIGCYFRKHLVRTFYSNFSFLLDKSWLHLLIIHGHIFSVASKHLICTVYSSYKQPDKDLAGFKHLNKELFQYKSIFRNYLSVLIHYYL